MKEQRIETDLGAMPWGHAPIARHLSSAENEWNLEDRIHLHTAFKCQLVASRLYMPSPKDKLTKKSKYYL